jgi:Heterokaryon incompatibility protein (HET)
MNLCSSCQRLKVQLLPDPVDRTLNRGAVGFTHSIAGELLDNVQQCPLCALIKASFLRVGLYHTLESAVVEHLRSTISSPILLRAGRKDGKRSSNGGANLTSIEVFVDDERKWLRGRFHLYAPQGQTCNTSSIPRLVLINAGSLAVLSADVVEKPLSVHPWPMRPNELVQKWLNSCVSNHNQCQMSFVGVRLGHQPPAILPRRLIQTFTENRQGLIETHPRLIQTDHNFLDHYVALSHCWGSPSSRPICTTKANLSQHMVEIAPQSLPQTFRDSISLCVELGTQYLWIDSLCIVQDDEGEWEQESAVMGSIYENAIFTIAASSAADSSHGLFGVKSALDLVQIPYFNVDGIEDQVFAYIEPDMDKVLSSAPLADRAWVMQEALLSRRIVHFTTHGLIWSCKNDRRPRVRHLTSEFGSNWTRVFEDDWEMLVASYSRRQLTHKSDKLIAIKGLANRFQQKYRKRYYYGLWIEDLPDGLLWYSDERLFRDTGNDIPSWSWASTTGPISFKSSVFDKHESICEQVLPVRDSPGWLAIRSAIKPINSLRGPLQCQAFCFEDLEAMDFTGRLHDDYTSGRIKVSPTYLLLSGTDKIGWAVFDEYERPPCPVFCLPLLEQEVWEGFALSRERQFLWTLIVRASSDLDKYQRVGWGLILVPSWLNGIATRDIYLE